LGTNFNNLYHAGTKKSKQEYQLKQKNPIKKGNRKMMKRIIFKLMLALGLILFLFTPSLARTPPTFQGMAGSNEGRFTYISKACIDNSGNIYVADPGNNRIQKFDSTGNFMRFFGGYGNDPGKFNYPVGIKVDGQGFIYVADTQNKRIQKLDPSGNPDLFFDTDKAPYAVEVDDSGNIYVLEGNDLSKYDSSGTTLYWKTGRYGSEGQFSFDRPRGLAIDSNGDIYVADTWHSCIAKFDAQGSFVWQFSVPGGDAVFDVAIDGNGNIYAAEHYSWRIGVFDPNGSWIKDIPAQYYAVSVSVDFAGNLYVTNYEDRLIKMDQNGDQLLSLGSNGLGQDEFAKPMGLSKDADGNVYVADQLGRTMWYTYSQSSKLGNHRIRKLDRDGNIVLSFGQNGRDSGEFYEGPNDVCVDSSRNIYVAGRNSVNGFASVQVFDSSGKFNRDFEVPPENPINQIFGISLDSGENIYVTDSGSGGTILKFTNAGGYLDIIDVGGYAPFYDIEIDDPEDNLFAVDNHGHKLKKIDNQGTLVFEITGSDLGLSAIYARGLDIDDENNIWVADTNNHRILCLDPEGTLLFQFGTQGFGPGEFQFPYDVAVTKGRVYVSDTYNQRIQIFSTNRPPTADANDNLIISSEDQSITVLEGIGTDPDDDPLIFRWLEGVTELCSWQNVGASGEASLDFNTGQNFSIGEHTLTLEVSDGQASSTDDMILTVDNSAPHAAPTGGGTYAFDNPVTLAGQVSDFDGDVLTYEWLEGTDPLVSGLRTTIIGGDPVDLPSHDITNFTIGFHTLTLHVNDGVNDPVTGDITVEIIDSTAPTLAPVPNKTILWPPNHKMVDIMIEANAGDNSGDPVTLSATVSSNEPEDGLDDEDEAPDWSELVIDQANGIIDLQLRSERSGSGDGRVYTITITATDASGNSSQSLVEIIVPHDKGKKK
jgi:sugar lactone lactonase YvrE